MQCTNVSFMKPNLFRSVQNALAEQFPLLPYIRQNFIGLLMFSILFILIGYSNEKKLVVAVEPVETSLYFNKPITNYGVDSVLLKGQLEIVNPTFLQKMLIMDASPDYDMFTLIMTAIISIIIIRLLPKLHSRNLFRKDISASIRLLGYLLIFHAMVSYYRTIVYTPGEIGRITNNEFTNHRTFPVLICAELYTAFLVIAIGSAFKKGIQLQQEQDLTV